MPDGNAVTDKSSAIEPTELQDTSELEKLIKEAETQKPPTVDQTTVSAVAVCTHEGTIPHDRRFCKSCSVLICDHCASGLDPTYCVKCLQENNFKPLVEEPLVDDEGTTHNGRHIIPSPGYHQLRWSPDGKTTAKLIYEMSELELTDFVEEYKRLVREAEKALDFRRIRLSGAQLELDERKDQKRRALRADKTKYPVRTVTLDPTTGKQVTKQASPAKLIEMMKMLEALAKLKGVKK